MTAAPAAVTIHVRRWSQAAARFATRPAAPRAAPLFKEQPTLAERRSFQPIMERTREVIDKTLRSVPKLAPGERHAQPHPALPLGDIPNPAGGSRAIVHAGLDPREVTGFAREQNTLFDVARDVLDFSGERILPVPVHVTAAAGPLPLTHVMPAEEVAREYGGHGLKVIDGAVELQGLDYLMQLRPLHRTPDGRTTGWNGQQPHFHQGPQEFHDQRLLHGFIPEGVTVVLVHPHGAEVAPGGRFVRIKIDKRAGHQFCTFHDALLAKDAELQARLKRGGPLEPEWHRRMLAFMNAHKVVEGLPFDSLSPGDLAAASALVVSSHTLDPKPTGVDGENLMAAQTMGVRKPQQFGTFVPWTAPPSVSR